MSREISVKTEGERYVDSIKSERVGHEYLRDHN